MEQVFQTAQEKMNKTVNAMMGEFATIRVGRANPSVLDKVMVDYYGVPHARQSDGGRVGSGTPHPAHRALGQKHPQTD